MPNDEIRGKLVGSRKYITGDPREVITVLEGSVYVYIVSQEKNRLKRSLFLREVSKGEKIPALTVQNNVNGTLYQFMITAKTEATIDFEEAGDDLDKIKEEFLSKIENLPAKDERFSVRLAEWYCEKLNKEETLIGEMLEEKKRVNETKFRMIKSLFSSQRLINYENSTPSSLYNTMSVYCEYMNVRICSYQTLVNNWGEDFSVQDIARLSHFVVRKVTLENDWYKHDSGAFLGFDKDNGAPLLFVPKNGSKYIMYDLALGIDKIIDSKWDANISPEVYVVYQHMPASSLKLGDVLKFGIKRIKTSDIVLFFLMYIITTLIGLLLPFLHEKLFDDLIPLGRMDAIYQIGVVMFACMIANIFFGIVQGLTNFRAIKTLEYNIVSATYDRVFRLPQKFIDSFGTSEFVSRINSVSQVFSQIVTSGVTATVGFILSLFYLWKMFSECKPLAFRGLIIAVISGVLLFFIGYLRIPKEREKLELATKANNTLYQAIYGILKVKVSGLENSMLYKFQKYNTKSMEADIKSTTINNIGNVLSTIFTMFGTGFIYYTVVKKKQELTIGEYTAFNSAYGMFTSSVTQLVSFFLTQAQLIPVMERIKPIFAQEAEITDSASMTTRLQGNIEVKHLEFAYDDDSQTVLKDINFTVNPGEFIGIVGPSGCGKSTLLKCLLGFENATKGKIFFDNRDIDTLDKCEMRRQMGIVLQDGKLVVGNIFTNITMAAPDMSVEQAEEILKEVGLYDEVKQMPMGIFTAISDGGGMISGGQQQRVLIARALANNPSMVLFDEATSALDNITQQKVCETLEKRNITRIMVAHRLSTVKNCDRIIVMDKGEIVEIGNYDELMGNKGLFYELCLRQEVGA